MCTTSSVFFGLVQANHIFSYFFFVCACLWEPNWILVDLCNRINADVEWGCSCGGHHVVGGMETRLPNRLCLKRRQPGSSAVTSLEISDIFKEDRGAGVGGRTDERMHYHPSGTFFLRKLTFTFWRKKNAQCLSYEMRRWRLRCLVCGTV